MNRVTLIGNVGKSALHAAGSTQVLKFSVATEDKYTDKQGVEQKRTEWANVVVWGKMAEALAGSVVQGARVFVEGSLKTSSYDKDGIKKYATDVSASTVHVIAPREKSSAPVTNRVTVSAPRTVPINTVAASNADEGEWWAP